MNPWWNIQVPLPVLLAAAATLGYMIGHWRRTGDLCPECKQKREAAAAAMPKADSLQKA
jgi:hypothetical protein